MTNTILAAAIQAERGRMEITVKKICRRVGRTNHQEVGADMYAMKLAGLLSVIGHEYNNAQLWAVTDAGYATAGVQRPFWMEVA